MQRKLNSLFAALSALVLIFALQSLTPQEAWAQDEMEDIEAELDMVEEDAESIIEEGEDSLEIQEEGGEDSASEDVAEDEVEEVEGEEDFEEIESDEVAETEEEDLDEAEEDLEEIGDDEIAEEDAEEEEEDDELSLEDEEEIAEDEGTGEDNLELEPLELVEDEAKEEEGLKVEEVVIDAPVTTEEPSFEAAMGSNDPDLSFEAKLHELYINYYSQKMPEEEWQQIAGGRQTEVYGIQTGDTLWGISSTLFGDGNYWPKVWSLNGRITNPHLIKPANQIKFMLGDEADAPAFTITEPEPEDPAVEVTAPPTTISSNTTVTVKSVGEEGDDEELEIPAPSVYSRPVVLRLPPSLPSWQSRLSDADDREYDELGIDYGRRKILDIAERLPLTAYVDEEVPDEIGQVSEIELGNRIANAFQYIFVHLRQGEAEIGDKYLVVNNGGKVEPVNDMISGPFGYSIKVQGEIQLTEKVEGQPKGQYTEVFRALVTKIINPVSVDSSIIRGKIDMVSVTDEGPRSSVQAQIIGGGQFNRRQVFGLQSFAFLNRGSNSGFEVGQVLPVRALRKLRNPNSLVTENARPIGWVKIVRVTPTFATGLIVRAWSEIVAGDLTGYGALGAETAELEQPGEFGDVEEVEEEDEADDDDADFGEEMDADEPDSEEDEELDFEESE